MAAQSAKIENLANVQPNEAASAAQKPALKAAETTDSAGNSPARDLQARLESEIFEDQKMSARSVTAMVLIVCLSTWVAGILLYASL